VAQHTEITGAETPWSGANAQADLISLVGHVLSQGSGASRPVNLTAGGIYSKDVGGGLYVPKLWDGTNEKALPPYDRTLMRPDAAGTANALTLATKQDLSAVPVGVPFWFIPSLNNTGAATVAIDGLTAIDLKTVTGDALPADYLRADVPTMAWYDGSDVICDRQTEYVTNANGEVWRFANNLQIILASATGVDINDALGNGYWCGGTTAAMPATFVGDSAAAGDVRTTATGWVNGRLTNGSAQFAFGAHSWLSRTGDTVKLWAIGSWY
jgi:hypothetical protein